MVYGRKKVPGGLRKGADVIKGRGRSRQRRGLMLKKKEAYSKC